LTAKHRKVSVQTFASFIDFNDICLKEIFGTIELLVLMAILQQREI
jgi:hypothetical protein